MKTTRVGGRGLGVGGGQCQCNKAGTAKVKGNQDITKATQSSKVPRGHYEPPDANSSENQLRGTNALNVYCQRETGLTNL